MYIVVDDETGREFRDHLVAAAMRGIQVSVLVDALGSWQLPDVFWNALRRRAGRSAGSGLSGEDFSCFAITGSSCSLMIRSPHRGNERRG